MRKHAFIGHLSILPVLMWVAAAAGEVNAKVVTFDARGGVKITADYYEGRKSVEPSPMVILLHMYNSDRSAWKPLIEPLHQEGFAILALDLRGHGQSATDELKQKVAKSDRRLFKSMEHDVYAAYEWLSKQNNVDRTRVALVGASVGCSVALRYSVSDPSVDAVVCMTPGTGYLGLNSTSDVKRMLGRKLLFLASEEERAASETLKETSDKAGKRAKDGAKANDVKVTIVAEGKVHGTAMFGKVDGIERQIVDFLKNGVGPWGDEPVYGAWKDKKFSKKLKSSKSADPGKIRFLSDAKEAISRGLKSDDPKPPPPPKGF